MNIGRVFDRCTRRNLFLPLIALASAGAPGMAHAGGYTALSPIVDYNPREYGVDLWIPQADNPAGCTQPSLFRLRLDAANYQVLAAFLLTQFSQAKAIRVYTNSCDWDGASIVVAAKPT
jgi:hypothetical protein